MPAHPARRLLPFTALAATAALLLSACATPGSEGGELVWSIEGANLSAGHMDPQVSQLDVSGLVQRAVLDSLVFQEADGTAPSLRGSRRNGPSRPTARSTRSCSATT
ncbi:hypothetical protein [Microbacterium maritypicum]|uniref:Solute-binding protein family 5 domain-containing protein n=1 Tax=Microbacterium maritypicum TaxID=33918 RepID=A0A4Y4B3B2_MICMQ|nr:hypothetical protein [Microbacterium liquefaciens]GEC74836.1 hypothetical protein MLI01_09810 [Microbacterium liquefaciens]GGV53340.1 hypothetical protein GCM10010213_10460 [Microbacterium liquefaciens]